MPRRSLVVALLVLAGLVVAAGACSDDGVEDVSRGGGASSTTDGGPPRPRQVGADFEPTYTPGACPTGVPSDRRVRCGWLEVRADRTRDRGETIVLAVAVVRARAERAGDEAVLYLAGGPGDSGLAAADGLLATDLFGDRDVVVLDQRGAGASLPSLDCPEVAEAVAGTFTTADGPSTEGARIETAFGRCRDRLEAAGVDPNLAGSAASADDVEDLRAALGYEQVDLYGISYGTRLALEVLRRHPDGVRAAVLDGVVPPGTGTTTAEVAERADAALDALDRACTASPTCSATLPDLRGSLSRAAARLDATPVAITLDDPAPGVPGRVLLTGRDLVAGVLLALYRPDLIPALPAAIAAAEHGDDAPLRSFAELALPQLGRSAEGMAASVTCADEPGDAPDAAAAMAAHPELSTFVLLSAVAATCDTWRAGPPPEPAGPVSWEGPVLLLSGALDPVTPPSLAEEAVTHLPAGASLTFPASGHGVLFGSECAADLVRGFLDDPTGPFEAACGTGPADPFAGS